MCRVDSLPSMMGMLMSMRIKSNAGRGSGEEEEGEVMVEASKESAAALYVFRASRPSEAAE